MRIRRGYDRRICRFDCRGWNSCCEFLNRWQSAARNLCDLRRRRRFRPCPRLRHSGCRRSVLRPEGTIVPEFRPCLKPMHPNVRLWILSGEPGDKRCTSLGRSGAIFRRSSVWSYRLPTVSGRAIAIRRSQGSFCNAPQNRVEQRMAGS